MRILILAPRAPYPPDHGAALRNLHILQWLGRRHEVTLVAYGDPNDADARRGLEQHLREVVLLPHPSRSAADRLGDLLGGHADLTRRLWSPSTVDIIHEHLKPPGFDIVQIEGLEMLSLWRAAAEGAAPRARVILDAHNAEYVLQASASRASLRRGDLLGGVYSLIQARRLRRFEREAACSADAVVAVSPEDAAALRALDPSLQVAVVPNGVDTDYYRPGERRSDGATALFIGKLDYRPNVDAVEWLVREIWPRVRARNPAGRLLVVGRDPLPRLARLGGEPGVKLVGPVRDEREWFDRSDLLVVPMRMGGGVRLKVVQAMAMGLPVVATPQGAAGLPVEDRTHYLGASTATEFAERVVEGFAATALRPRLAERALELVRERFDWRAILPRLDCVYAGLSGTR